MAIPTFETLQQNLSFDLSRIDPNAPKDIDVQPHYYLTTNLYRVDGVNGGRPMSMGGLVMALCLARATQMEADIIETMSKMEETTDDLEMMTRFQERLLSYESNEIHEDEIQEDELDIIYKFGLEIGKDKKALLSTLDAKMDSLNSFSQQVMIDLQSKTKKRDQAYDMITNILKALFTTENTITNNM